VIPMYLLIGIWGSGPKEYSAMKLTLMLMGGSALLLVGLLGIYFNSATDGGRLTFDLTEIAKVKIPYDAELFFFPFTFIGFGVLALVLLGALAGGVGLSLVILAKTGLFGWAPAVAALLAAAAFSAVYAVMVLAAVAVRSAALSAASGGGALLLFLVAGHRADLAPVFSDGLARTLFLAVTAPLPRLSGLGGHAFALARGEGVQAGLLLAQLGGTALFSAAALALAALAGPGAGNGLQVAGWLAYVLGLGVVGLAFAWTCIPGILPRAGLAAAVLHVAQGTYLLVILYGRSAATVPPVALTAGRLLGLLVLAVAAAAGLGRASVRAGQETM